MSRDNAEKKKLSREERKKAIVRIIAMIMAILPAAVPAVKELAAQL